MCSERSWFENNGSPMVKPGGGNIIISSQARLWRALGLHNLYSHYHRELWASRVCKHKTQSVLRCIWLSLLEPHMYSKFTTVYELTLFWMMVPRRRSHFCLVVALSALNYSVESDMFDYALPRTIRLLRTVIPVLNLNTQCVTHIRSTGQGEE